MLIFCHANLLQSFLFLLLLRFLSAASPRVLWCVFSASASRLRRGIKLFITAEYGSRSVQWSARARTGNKIYSRARGDRLSRMPLSRHATDVARHSDAIWCQRYIPRKRPPSRCHRYLFMRYVLRRKQRHASSPARAVGDVIEVESAATAYTPVAYSCPPANRFFFFTSFPVLCGGAWFFPRGRLSARQVLRSARARYRHACYMFQVRCIQVGAGR